MLTTQASKTIAGRLAGIPAGALTREALRALLADTTLGDLLAGLDDLASDSYGGLSLARTAEAVDREDRAMSKEITVSDDYIWTTSTGMYQWIVEYLRDRVPDQELWDFVETEGFVYSDNFFVSDLPEPYRRQVLRVLAEEVPEAYATWRFRSLHERAENRRTIASLEIVGMMAAEVLRELDGGARQ